MDSPDEATDDCSLCAIGAMTFALTKLAPDERYWSWWPCGLAIPVGEIDVLTPDSNIVSYNDAPETTAEDVAALFERAAEIHRGETVEV